MLQKLNNIEKHRILLTVGSAYRSFDLGAVASAELARQWKAGVVDLPEAPPMFQLFVDTDPQFPLVAGAELFKNNPGAEIVDIRFGFDIALCEPGVVSAKPLMQLVTGLHAAVSDVANQLKPHLV
jgi:hypothetical protein